jgi:hypothetical protein
LLHALYIISLSGAWFANKFSLLGCLFILFIISFALQKLFSLLQTYLSIFASIVCVLGTFIQVNTVQINILELFSKNSLLMDQAYSQPALPS